MIDKISFMVGIGYLFSVGPMLVMMAVSPGSFSKWSWQELAFVIGTFCLVGFFETVRFKQRRWPWVEESRE